MRRTLFFDRFVNRLGATNSLPVNRRIPGLPVLLSVYYVEVPTSDAPMRCSIRQVCGPHPVRRRRRRRRQRSFCGFAFNRAIHLQAPGPVSKSVSRTYHPTPLALILPQRCSQSSPSLCMYRYFSVEEPIKYGVAPMMIPPDFQAAHRSHGQYVSHRVTASPIATFTRPCLPQSHHNFSAKIDVNW